MPKHLLAAAAAAVLMSGVAAAQTYPPAPPPLPYPPPPPAVPVAPPAPVPGSSTSTTTTVTPTPDGGYRASTVNKGVDPNGNEVTKKDVYREGVAGSSEAHTKTETNPFGETTTRSTTTNTPR